MAWRRQDWRGFLWGGGPPPPNKLGPPPKHGPRLKRAEGPPLIFVGPPGAGRGVQNGAAPQPPNHLASDYCGTRGCPVQRFWPWRHRSTRRPRSAGERMERWRRPAKTCRASGMPNQRQGDEVIGRGLVTVMASSSANVEA